jgi:hypothetical protein
VRASSKNSDTYNEATSPVPLQPILCYNADVFPQQLRVQDRIFYVIELEKVLHQPV